MFNISCRHEPSLSVQVYIKSLEQPSGGSYRSEYNEYVILFIYKGGADTDITMIWYIPDVLTHPPRYHFLIRLE